MRVFISYAKRDGRELAKRLDSAINAVDGLSAWMDDSLETGQSWARQIEKEIDGCDLFIVLISPDVNRDPAGERGISFVLNEISRAQANRKPILPVLVAQTPIPVELASLQFIDATRDSNGAVNRAIRDIKQRAGLVEAPPEPIRQPPPARRQRQAPARSRIPVGRMIRWAMVPVLVIAVVGVVQFLGPALFGPRDMELSGHSDFVNTVAFSPDGGMVASGSIDDTVRLWNVAGGSLRATLMGHTDDVYAVAFSPDGSRIASGGYDHVIRLWDVDSGETIKTLSGHTDLVNALAFHPNGRHLASASDDNTVRIWDVETGEMLSTLVDHTANVLDVDFNREGFMLASASADRTVRLWLWGAEQAVADGVLEGHEGAVSAVAFSPDDLVIASGGTDETIHLWSTTSSSLIGTLNDHVDSVVDLDFNPDGSLLASGSYDDTVRFWDVELEREVAVIREIDASVLSVAFSPDGARLAAGVTDGTVRVWVVDQHLSN